MNMNKHQKIDDFEHEHEHKQMNKKKLFLKNRQWYRNVDLRI